MLGSRKLVEIEDYVRRRVVELKEEPNMKNILIVSELEEILNIIEEG